MRRPYATVALVALLARVIVAVGVFVMLDGSYFLDDAAYADLAADYARGDTASWTESERWLFVRTSTMLIPLAGVFALFGPSILVGQLFVALFGVVTAVLTARLAAEVAGPRAALLAGVTMALLPSQVMVSASVMKDALVWTFLTALALVVSRATRLRGRRLLAMGLVAGVLLSLLGYLRLHSLIVAALALVLSSRVVARRDRVAWTAGALMLFVAVPWLVGGGPAGIGVVAGVQPLEDIRQAHATGGSAVGAARRPQNDPFGGRVDENNAALVGAADIRYLPTGLRVMLLEPLPWRPAPSTAFRLAQAENVLWYGLLVLAAVGIPHLRRWRHSVAFPVVAGGGSLVMWALVEGNIGTAFRHRGEFTWVIVLLAALTADRMLSRCRDETPEEHRGETLLDVRS